ncbi:MAG: thymidine phosphorylase, partial [Rhodospirillaceae bacterium]|nr:thymidine phosphorylase [Rhodospirillaceae bacterium]
GNGVGPVLEARDVMRVLEGNPLAPRDLRDRALLLAGHILEFDPRLRGGQGHARARELLDSGAAAKQMQAIIEAQGPSPVRYELGELKQDVLADADGIVAAIDCYRIARLARMAGAPTDKGAGIDLFKKVGQPVQRGEPLYRIHAAHPTDFRFVGDMVAQDNGYAIAGG